MSNVIKLTGGFSGSAGTNSMISFDIGSVQSKIWVRFQVYIPAATYTMWNGGGLGFPWWFLQSPDTNFIDWVTGVGYQSNKALHDGWFNAPSKAGSVITDQWQVMEFFADSSVAGSPGWYKLDGWGNGFQGDTGVSPPSGRFNTRRVWIGFDGADGYRATSTLDAYIGKVQIGTAKGTADILDYDPATTNYTPTFSTLIGTGGAAIAMAAPPTPNPSSMALPSLSAGSLKFHYGGVDTEGQSGVAVALEHNAQTSLYQRVEFLISTANSATVASSYGGALLLAERNAPGMAGGFPNNYGEQLYIEDSGGMKFELSGTGAFYNALTLDAWNVIESFWQMGGASYLKVNNAVLASYTGHAATAFWNSMFWNMIGVAFLGNGSAFDVWFNRIKIGTTDGGSEIISYDPALELDLFEQFIIVGTGTNDNITGATPPVPPPSGGSPNLQNVGVTPPVPVSATIVSGVLTITFDLILDSAHVPGNAQFAVNINGNPAAVTGVTVPGDDTCGVLVSPAAAFGDLVTVQYTKV